MLSTAASKRHIWNSLNISCTVFRLSEKKNEYRKIKLEMIDIMYTFSSIRWSNLVSSELWTDIKVKDVYDNYVHVK